MPGPLPPSMATATEWTVPPLPPELRQPGIEISGPAADTRMLITALNPPQPSRPVPASSANVEFQQQQQPQQQQQQPQQYQQLSVHSTPTAAAAAATPGTYALYAAVGDLDDDEDAGGHSLTDTVRAALNRRDALRGVLRATTGDKTYSLVSEEQRPGKRMPFMMHRERGLHLDEREFTVDGIPVCATILGTALTCFYAGAEHARRGEGCFFYIPKTESAAEVALYRDLFTACAELMPHLRVTPLVPEYAAVTQTHERDWITPIQAPPHHVEHHGHDPMNAAASADNTKMKSASPAVPLTIIRAIVLIESLPAVWEMEEMLYALGSYAAGLNAARWDLKASLLEYTMARGVFLC